MRTRLLTLFPPNGHSNRAIARVDVVRRLRAVLCCVILTMLLVSGWEAQAEEPAPLDLADQTEITDLRAHTSVIFPDVEYGDDGLASNITIQVARTLAGSPKEHPWAEVIGKLAAEDPSLLDGNYLLGPVWVRLILTNSGDTTERWRIDAREAYGPSLRAFATNDSDTQLILDNRWVTQAMDQRFPQERLVASNIIEVPSGGTTQVWIDAEFGLPTDSYLRLVNEERFDADRQSDLVTAALIFGARVALLLALIAFAIVLRDRTALYYAGFHTGLLLVSLSQWGFDSFYLGLGEMAGGIAFRLTWACTLVFYALTVASFLDARVRYPRYARALFLSTMAGLIFIPVLSIFDFNVHWQWIRPFFEAGIFGQFVIIVGAGIFLAVRDKLPGAKWFLFASAMLLMLAVMQALFASQALPMTTWEVDASINLIFAVDGLLFAAALVVRAIDLRRQRDQAQLAELDALSEQANLHERLSEAEREYDTAARLAEQHRRKLEATNHDLKQPLLSLQMALAKMDGVQDAVAGVSYIERILRKNSAEDAAEEEIGDAAADGAKAGFELAKALHNVTTMFQDEAAALGITISPVATSARVLAEPVMLMRILANLVSNAIQHSQGTRIVLGAKQRGNSWNIIVADNGRGISDDDLPSIFARYHKGDTSDGDGIGLASVQELAGQQGWTVTANRLPSGGAVFAIEGVHPHRS